MPAFKPKPTKRLKCGKKTSLTLDNTHKDFLQEFAKDLTDKIPKLKTEKAKLKNTLQHETRIEERLDLKDSIEAITKEINTLQIKKKEYFLDNSKYIFDYFENKKNISLNSNTDNNKNLMINNFFKIKQEDCPNIGNNSVDKNIVQKYLSNINDDAFLNINSYINPTDVCQYCHKGELIPVDDEGILVCNLCAKIIPYLLENDKPSYK